MDHSGAVRSFPCTYDKSSPAGALVTSGEVSSLDAGVDHCQPQISFLYVFYCFKGLGRSYRYTKIFDSGEGRYFKTIIVFASLTFTLKRIKIMISGDAGEGKIFLYDKS